MGKTKISWTDESSNPIYAVNRETGERGWACVRVSDGCKHCYAATLNQSQRWHRGTGLDYTVPSLEHVDLQLDEAELQRWILSRRPHKKFVCSMTDLFGEFVSDEWITRVFAAMALSPHITFQVLTKRAERMRALLSDGGPNIKAWGFGKPTFYEKIKMASWEFRATDKQRRIRYPFPNVWLGVSVENQRAADERIPFLLEMPAAIRFLSCEPLLEEIDINSPCIAWSDNNNRAPIPLDWVIVGGESGPGFRPMRDEWASSLRDQCAAARVPFFFKQHSGYRPQENALLDGVEYHEFPETAAK